jgi:hypothetical protein
MYAKEFISAYGLMQAFKWPAAGWSGHLNLQIWLFLPAFFLQIQGQKYRQTIYR